MTSWAHLSYVLSVWIHILAAIVWMGGMAFLVLVLVGPLRRMERKDIAAELLHVTGRRFRTVGWVCFALLVVTGLYNLKVRGLWGQLGDVAFWATPFGSVLLWKLVLVGVLLAFSVAHDFFLGPRATAALRNDPRSADAQKLRWWSSVLGRATFVLALIVILLSVMLVRGRPF
jgi:uncharacterized membrane protein